VYTLPPDVPSTALALDEERFRSLVEDLDAVVWEADAADDKNRFVSRNAEAVLGYSIEEWLTQPSFWEDHLHPDDRAATIAAHRTTTERGESHTLEYRMIAADGRTVWIGDRVRVVLGDDGRPLLRGVMVDITADKENELALCEATQQYRALVEQAPICTYRQDASGERLLYIGPQAEELTGYAPEEWADDRFADWLHPDDRDRVLQDVARCRAEGRAFEMEYRLLTRDDRTIWVLDRTVPIRDERGRIAFRQGFVLDITAAKEAETALHVRDAQLRQAQKLEAIGNLAGVVAHDFNNVLLVIRGYCALLLEPPADTAEADSVLQIDAAAERGADLVRQLLAYGRRQRLEPVDSDLNMIVTETSTFLRRLIGEDVELRTRLDAWLPAVYVDPARIEEAIVNLAANARDAMPGGGTLEIATRVADLPDDDDELGLPGGRYVALSVTDTGVGMDGSVAAQVFDPFFTTKLEGHGTGLGLAMVHGFAAQSRGAVSVETAAGEGTTFTLYFPASVAAASAPEPKPKPRPLQAGGESILLVEDEPQVRNVVAKMLRRNGYEVVDVARPAQALELLADGATTVDLLVTDVVMPEMSGIELAKRARALRSDVRVLFMSGYEPALTPEDDRALRASLLLKPFGYLELTAAVHAALERAVPGVQ
jgi:two-component system, cell cycle sensor histidine kinase and response regulator CckA